MPRNTNSKGPRRRESLAALDAFRRIAQMARNNNGPRHAGAHPRLTPAAMQVLAQLLDSPQMSLKELAKRTHTHQSSVSVVVKKLVAAKFVKRSHSSADLRQQELSLTPRGVSTVRSAPASARDRLADGLSCLKDTEIRALTKLLKLVVDCMMRGDVATDEHR